MRTPNPLASRAEIPPDRVQGSLLLHFWSPDPCVKSMTSIQTVPRALLPPGGQAPGGTGTHDLPGPGKQELPASYGGVPCPPPAGSRAGLRMTRPAGRQKVGQESPANYLNYGDKNGTF